MNAYYVNSIYQGINGFARIIFIVNIIISIIVFVLYFHQNFYTIASLFIKRKRIPEAQKEHAFQVLICAHNEEKVIGELIESIQKQKYPSNKIKVLVVADNCNDNTADVARKYNVEVIERTSSIKGKSYAMDYAIKYLIENDKLDFEALFIFDSDNLLSLNYFEEMNKLFDKGYLVGNSFRNSKNFSSNWLSKGASMMFLRESTVIHPTRSKIIKSSYIAGTGYYISKKILLKLNGWNFHTLTEDLEFSIYLANHHIRIGYNENAIFYDEQPTSFKDSWNQRLRWCRGTHQCFYKYGLSLWYDITPIRFELFAHAAPMPAISFAWSIIYLTIMSIFLFIPNSFMSLNVYLLHIIVPTILSFLSLVLIALLNGLIVIIKKNKLLNLSFKEAIQAILIYPLYMFLFLPISFIALFKKVTWKQINHLHVMHIEDMEKKHIS